MPSEAKPARNPPTTGPPSLPPASKRPPAAPHPNPRRPAYPPELLLDPPAGTAFSRLPIRSEVVAEVLLAQPHSQIAAPRLAALFHPSNHTQRRLLAAAVSRVGELVQLPSGPTIRLAGSHPARAHVPTHALAPTPVPPSISSHSPTPPQPVTRMALRNLLLSAPLQQMEISSLRAHFNPQGEEERRSLAVCISEEAELLSFPHPGGVRRFARLKRSLLEVGERAEAKEPSEGVNPTAEEKDRGGRGGNGGEDGVPVTSMERELVRRLLMGAPGGALRSDEIARMLSADSDQVMPLSLTPTRPSVPPFSVLSLPATLLPSPLFTPSSPLSPLSLHLSPASSPRATRTSHPFPRSSPISLRISPLPRLPSHLALLPSHLYRRTCPSPIAPRTSTSLTTLNRITSLQAPPSFVHAAGTTSACSGRLPGGQGRSFARWLRRACHLLRAAANLPLVRTDGRGGGQGEGWGKG